MGATARQFVEAMLDARRPESAPISNENLCLLYLAKVHDALAESVAALEEGRRICIECDINSAAVEDCAAMMGEVNAVKADLERVTKERDDAWANGITESNALREDLAHVRHERNAAQRKLERVRELVSHGTAKGFRQWAETYQNRGSYSDARLSRWCADLLDILNEEQT